MGAFKYLRINSRSGNNGEFFFRQPPSDAAAKQSEKAEVLEQVVAALAGGK